MGKNKEKIAAREAKIARVIIEAEFEVDSVDITDIMINVRNAVEELQAYGYVKSAKLNMPATEVDLAE